MKFIETDTTWIIEDQLDTEIIHSIKSFLDKNINLMYRDEKGYSTSGKDAKQYWIKNRNESTYLYSTTEFVSLRERYKKEILKRVEEINLFKINVDLNIIGCWTVIGEKGSYHNIHNHGVGFGGISTVLYLEVPEILKDEDGYNSNVYFVMHTNPQNYHMQKSSPSILHIEPKPGKILIFPHYVPHGTYPQTKGIRQTFNIDYSVKFKSESSLNYS